MKRGRAKEVAQQMGWETRGNSRYYYRKRKVAGRVVSEYVGTGLHAARVVAQEAAAREAELDAFYDLTDALVGAALLNAGYHRHHRGEWRKQRG